MNAAERLLSIYTKLISEKGDQKMQVVWSNILGIKNTDHVIDALQALKSQIDAVRASLDAKGVPRDLQDPGLHRLREAAGLHPRDMWKSYQGNLTPPECSHCLRLAVWVLRDEEEDAVDGEVYSALLKELGELKAAALHPEISTYLRSFILRQVDTIEAALRLYNVAGVKPIKEALRTVAGDLVVEKQKLDAEFQKGSEETTSTMGKLGRFVKTVAEKCDQAEKIKKAGDTTIALAQSVAPYVGQAIDFLKSM